MNTASRLLLILMMGALGLPGSNAANFGGIAPARLRCDSCADPVGIDSTNPRLGWILESRDKSARGLIQRAFQVLAASSPVLLAKDQGDLWDSGKIISDQTYPIAYAGSPLKSDQAVWWKVRVWDGTGKVSAWSSPAQWVMGLLDPTQWQGAWLCAPDTQPGLPIFRREFVVQPGLQRALISICGLGHYELSANGSKVGDALLAPGWSKYDKTCLYDTLDITSCLTNGRNALGVMLGNGMYNIVPASPRYAKFTGSFGPPKLIAQLHLFYANGTSQVIATDGQWLTTPGPITFSSVYGGEDYDARRLPAGWNEAGFNASAWSPPVLTHGPGGILRGTSHAAPLIKAIQTLQPIQTNTISSSAIVYDLGQNASLIPRLTAHGPAGSMIRITPAELTHTNGTVDRGSCGGGSAYWQYTLAGNGTETWFPRFFYQGCRFLQVQLIAAPGFSQLPVVDHLQGVVIQSATAQAGEFSCSNDLFNRTRTLILWAQRNNMVSLLTDCPHRERLGWLEQYHLHGPSLRYEWDIARLYSKTLDDMTDSQLANGLVPDIAPEYTVFSGGFRDSPEWGSSVVLVPWQQYQFTGDDTLLRRHYQAMSNYVAYLGSQASGGILNRGLGDWYDLGPNPPGGAQLTPVALTATAFFYQDAQILGQAARILGRTNDAVQFDSLTANIRTAFNHSFYSATNGCYSTGSQTAQSIPLVMGLVDSNHQASVVAALVANVRSQGLTAGDIGHRYLLRALADAGRSDVVFDLHSQTNRPGYGCILNTGATALTEGWDGSNSRDHFMLGHIIEWFYHDLAGIQLDPQSPGFKHFIIHPNLVGDLTEAHAGYNSVRGKIVSEWKLAGKTVTLHVVVPPNATATIDLPTRKAGSVTENGKTIAKAKGVTLVKHSVSNASYRVGSGDYTFKAEWVRNSRE